MARKRSDQKPVACPACGSYDFNVAGCVAYLQPFNSKTESYGASEIAWEADWPQYVECAGCDRDVTELFRKDGMQFYRHLKSKGGRD